MAAVAAADADVFSDVHNNAGRNEHSTQLAMVLNAVTEVVTMHMSGGGRPTPVHYFAALMSSIEGGDAEHVPALLELLRILAKKSNGDSS